MMKLSKPSKELAERILAEVGYDNRLIGFRLHERLGAIPLTMYSFEEVVRLLNSPNPRLDFNRLEEWVRKIMGDEELAGKIREAAEKGESDQERTRRIRYVMNERLSQCKTFSSAKS